MVSDEAMRGAGEGAEEENPGTDTPQEEALEVEVPEEGAPEDPAADDAEPSPVDPPPPEPDADADPQPDAGVDTEERLRREAMERAAAAPGEEEPAADDPAAPAAAAPKPTTNTEDLDPVTLMLINDLNSLKSGEVPYNDFVDTLDMRLDGLDPSSVISHLFTALRENFTSAANESSTPDEMANAYVSSIEHALDQLPVSFLPDTPGRTIGRETGLDLSPEAMGKLNDYVAVMNTEVEGSDVDTNQVFRQTVETSAARSALQLIEDVRHNRANIIHTKNEDGELKLQGIRNHPNADGPVAQLSQEFATRLGLEGEDRNAFRNEFREQLMEGGFLSRADVADFVITPDEIRSALNEALDEVSDDKQQQIRLAMEQAEHAGLEQTEIAAAAPSRGMTPS